jgi:hypothetical protein
MVVISDSIDIVKFSIKFVGTSTVGRECFDCSISQVSYSNLINCKSQPRCHASFLQSASFALAALTWGLFCLNKFEYQNIPGTVTKVTLSLLALHWSLNG